MMKLTDLDVEAISPLFIRINIRWTHPDKYKKAVIG